VIDGVLSWIDGVTETATDPEVGLMLVVISVLAMFAAVFAAYLVVERDPERAAQRTTNGLLSMLMGVGTVVVAAAAEGIDLLAEVPGVIIGVIGIGSIMAGISWEMFGATALLVYIGAAAVGRG